MRYLYQPPSWFSHRIQLKHLLVKNNQSYQNVKGITSLQQTCPWIDTVQKPIDRFSGLIWCKSVMPIIIRTVNRAVLERSGAIKLIMR